MARKRLFNRYVVLLLVTVAVISAVSGALGFRRLKQDLFALERESAWFTLAAAEAMIRRSGSEPLPGSVFIAGRGSVRLLPMRDFRRIMGLVGSLPDPIEITRLSVTKDGVQVTVARSLPNSSLILLTERESPEADELLGSAMAGLWIAGTLLVLATALFAVASVRSLGDMIFKLDDALKRYSTGDLRHRVLVTDPPALAGLARRLNTVAAQLSAQIAGINQRRKELESILASMVEGVIVVDRRKRITAINAAAARTFNVDPDGALGKSIIAFLRNSDVDDFASETLSGESPKERTITLFDLQPVHVQLHGTVLRGEGGTIAGGVIVTSDVTRVRRLETIRREFVANVSHELRTPITSILGFVETLQEGAIEDPDRARRFLEIILAHTTRLNLIIEDLLSLSRLESYDAQIPMAPCQIHDIVNGAMLASAPAATQKRIRIEDNYSGSTRIVANATLLEQAIRNLMDNAVKYSPEDSRVRVVVRSGDDDLTVEVTDEGVGIPAAALPRIFERFYRVDRARSRDLGGTGLGLAIVKHIALAHGGHVSVESVPGKGSSFVLSIPQKQGQDSEAS